MLYNLYLPTIFSIWTTYLIQTVQYTIEFEIKAITNGAKNLASPWEIVFQWGISM